MKLSEETRLILYNQYEILKKLHPDYEEEYKLNQEIIYHGYEYNYEELGDFSSVYDEETSRFVFNVFNMIDALQISYSNLSKEDKLKINKEDLYFKGYDGNEEIEYSYARFVIKDLKRYDGLEIEDFNSHCNMVDTYKRMLDKWYNYGKHFKLSVEQIKDIIDNYY